MSDEASMTACVVVAVIALVVMMAAAGYSKREQEKRPDFPPIISIPFGVAAFLFFVMAVWGVGVRL